MFNIFKKTKEIPNATTTIPNVNIATLLVIAMTEYLKKAECASSRSVPVITDIREQYERLSSLGMGSTQNALELKRVIDNADNISNDIRKAHELISFVKYVHSDISSKSVLVSNEKFDELCNKYNLHVALLSDYCGVIPEKNIQDH